jgi:hypothetical protein
MEEKHTLCRLFSHFKGWLVYIEIVLDYGVETEPHCHT